MRSQKRAASRTEGAPFDWRGGDVPAIRDNTAHYESGDTGLGVNDAVVAKRRE